MSTTAYTLDAPSKSDKYSKIGTTAGTAAGIGGLLFNKPASNASFSVKCAKCEKMSINKDLFEKTYIINKNKPVKTAVMAALIVCAATAAGALIGKGIGKLVDKHNQKKQEKENLHQAA
ncbi:MAG: hypothetical protein LUH05_01940 [Candidatus Gastranaerophilales bacterium]|nr:hypothetical protein [Candidatus Gastranaerophilales bacterium]